MRTLQLKQILQQAIKSLKIQHQKTPHNVKTGEIYGKCHILKEKNSLLSKFNYVKVQFTLSIVAIKFLFAFCLLVTYEL